MATLGKKYRDKVTGFEGVAVSEHLYLQGCTRVTLEKLSESEDKIIDLTFDEPNLTDMGMTVVKPEVGFVPTGGPHDHETPLDQH